MGYSLPRINDPRFLFFRKDEFFADQNIKLSIELDYRYLNAQDLAVLLLERVGLEAFNLPHALDTLEDNTETMDGAFITVTNFCFDDAIKANDLIGMVQIVAYIIFRSGAKIRFYMEMDRKA